MSENPDDHTITLAPTNKRVGNTDWFECGNCHVEDREIDCPCCQEMNALTEENFEGKFMVVFNIFKTREKE